MFLIFQINSFDFRDSLQLVPTSLAKMVQEMRSLKMDMSLLKKSRLVANPLNGQFDQSRFDLVMKSKG